jgi:hypothetical protein
MPGYNLYNPCETSVELPVIDPCVNENEGGRVRGIAYVHKSFFATLSADPDNPVVWAQGIAQGQIITIPRTSGTFDGGSPVEVPGYGDTESDVIGFKFVLSYKDPNIKGNTPFYNTIKAASGQYHVAFRTENLTRISDNPCTVIPKSPVEEDMTSRVVWNVDVKFNGEDHPVPFDTPTGVFE